MSEDASPEVPARGWLGPARLGIGLAQGLAGFLLDRSWEAKAWPATSPMLFWALVLFVFFWPLILLSGLGGLRRRTLIAWSVVSGLLILAFGAYDIWRQAPLPLGSVFPSGQVILAIATALFVGHHLVVAGEGARRWIGPYTAYYDAAWKDGVQLALAWLFVGVFWGLLWLGAELFKLIGISAFETFIQKDWFAYPATGVMFAWAVQLTDARANLTRGVRTIMLALLSWLMPLMAAIVAAFVIALPFTGLGPLWRTHAAGNVLLSAAAALIVLVNATYHDGTPERRPLLVLRWAGRLAAVLVAPLVLIAGYGILLRVHQYGWSPQRIVALACGVVGASYAAGYVVAAVRPAPWLKPLERTNIITALVILAVIVALFSPAADPARISVADQLARLDAGKTPVDRFDFDFLRFQGVRFGKDALGALKARKTGPNAALIAQRATDEETGRLPSEPPTVQPATIVAHIEMYPKGKTLPKGFLNQRWESPNNQYLVGPCVALVQDCDGFLIDMDGDGVDEVLLADDSSLWVYKVGPDGRWTHFGTLNPMDEKLRGVLRAGKFAAVASPWKDLQVGQVRLRFSPHDAATPEVIFNARAPASPR